jgi:hypothetical protein
VIAALAAIVILSLTIGLAIELLFHWSSGDPVRGRHVIGVCLLVLLLSWRIGTRILTGTM